MGFHLLAYTGTTGAAAADFDLTAATEPDFSQRSSHYIFTNPFKLIAAAVFGATLTRANMQIPQWNAWGRFNIWPVNTALIPPSNAQFDVWRDMGTQIPQNEELSVKTSNTGAGEQNTAFLWVGTPDWNANLPMGRPNLEVRCTAAVTSVANTWAGLTALVFEQSLRGGAYAVLGAQFVTATCQAFRLVFPRGKVINGQKLRPGYLGTATIGQVPAYPGDGGPFWLGEWGRFHSFEPPQIEVFCSTSATVTGELRMWLAYLGESDALLQAA